MTKLSVNVNKIATLRNARGGDVPNVVQVAKDCELFGADGITIHPRPDERHITTQDVYDLAKVVQTEFNIEGYPDERFMKLCEEVRPHQATLVPDPPHVLTSNAGWNVREHHSRLKDTVDQLKDWGIRTSIFLDPDLSQLEMAPLTGTDRIELYTEAFAVYYKNGGVEPYVSVGEEAAKMGIGLNAGHDLNLDNLRLFSERVPQLLEVSIGHALIADALYYGLENTIQMYKRCLMPVEVKQ